MSREKFKKPPYKFIIFYSFPYVGGNGMDILNIGVPGVGEEGRKKRECYPILLPVTSGVFPQERVCSLGRES